MQSCVLINVLSECISSRSFNKAYNVGRQHNILFLRVLSYYVNTGTPKDKQKTKKNVIPSKPIADTFELFFKWHAISDTDWLATAADPAFSKWWRNFFMVPFSVRLHEIYKIAEGISLGPSFYWLQIRLDF